MVWIVLLICSLILCGFLYYKLNQKQILDYNAQQQLQQQEQALKNAIQILDSKKLNLEQEISKTSKTAQELQDKFEQERFKYYDTQAQIQALNAQKEELNNNLEIIKQQQTHYAQDIYDQALKTAELSFDQEINRINTDLNKNREIAQETYLNALEEYSKDFEEETEILQQQKQELQEQLNNLKQIVNSAVEARKRQEEQETNQDFYRLQLSEQDLLEIKKLREILPYLRDKEPLNKVIYKVYYEKPYTNLVGRVLSKEKVTGIYKITSLASGKVYVGQSVNIPERWRQHIKRGVGAEPPTRNKIYAAMLEEGVENFLFEPVEFCEAKDLDEKEQFWQEYFHAKDYGFSIK